jgi:DNA-binding beta-propeller fold protein YncE
MTSRIAAALLLAASLAACKSEVVCTSAQVTCGGQCTSLASDPAHCGACDHACGAAETCSQGICCQGEDCLPAVYAACFNTDSVQGATRLLVPIGAPVPVMDGPISLAWRGAGLWVANCLSNTLSPMKVTPAGLSLDGAYPTVKITGSPPFDLEFLAERDGLLYVSNASVGSLLVVDPLAMPSVLKEISFGTYSYPQGIAFAGNNAYVALNGSNSIAVVDLTTRTMTKAIDLSTLVTGGGFALPARMVASGNRLYVTLWNLNAAFFPAGNGLLAVVDTTTDELASPPNPLDLGPGCENPAGIALLGGTAWVTCGFLPYGATSTTDIRGTAFVPVDVSTDAPVVGTAVPATGTAPGPIVFCNGKGYVGDRFSGDVLQFDPASRTIAGRGLVCPAISGMSSYIPDLTCAR